MDDRGVGADEIAGGGTSGGGVGGTGVIVGASGFAIAIATLAGFDETIRTHGGAIRIVEAGAPRGTAPIFADALGDVAMSAYRIAGGGRTVEGVGGTDVGIVTGAWAIAITEFGGFDDSITADRRAIAIVIMIASARAALIAIGTKSDVRMATR